MGGGEEPVIVHVNSMLKEIVPGFVERRRQEVADMGQLLAQGDWEGLRIAGHSLKGSAGAYGFQALTEIGLALEEAAKSADSARVQQELGRYGDYLARVQIVYD